MELRKRRMWAGGSFRFNPERGLVVGSRATAFTHVSSVEMKGFNPQGSDQGTKSNPLVFVQQQIEYRQQCSPILIEERRLHAYLPSEVKANKRKIKEGNYLK